MKTRHKAGQSWSVIQSTSLKKYHLEQCTPQELQDMMTAGTDPRVLEAKTRFLAQLAAINVTKTNTDIVMELINIPCGFRLHNDTQGAMKFKQHMQGSHKINMDTLRPSFTKDADCKSFKHLEKIKTLPKPLTEPMLDA